MCDNYKKIITNKINSFDKGYAFSIIDFQNIASQNTINQILVRLCEEGKIRRIMQGIYDKPIYSNVIKEYSTPNAESVAYALARKFNWTIAPSGNTALNLLHLQTQMSNVWDYVSDGPNKTYKFYNISLNFHKSMSREIAGFHSISIIVIQALRSIGESNVTNEDISILKSNLTSKEKEIILEETKTSTNWIYEIIKKVCEKQ